MKIAVILGIQVDAARVRLKRARRKLGLLGDSGAIERSYSSGGFALANQVRE